MNFSSFAGRGDQGISFRQQNSRNLHEVDQLLAHKANLRLSIGDSKANEIEAFPDSFADADGFRIYHAKARFRATWTTLAVAIGGSTIAAKQLGLASHGTKLLRQHGMLSAGALMGTWLVSYKAWHYIVGWNSQEQSEYLYAQHLRMLRNLQIRS